MFARYPLPEAVFPANVFAIWDQLGFSASSGFDSAATGTPHRGDLCVEWFLYKFGGAFLATDAWIENPLQLQNLFRRENVTLAPKWALKNIERM
jgi:hypothetical protein